MLWDVDHTLIDAGGGLSGQLYEAVFRELFGRGLPQLPSMAGRTDHAIILEALTRAGIEHPARYVGAFVAGLTAGAAAFGEQVRRWGRVLPGAAEAIAALAGEVNKPVDSACWPEGHGRRGCLFGPGSTVQSVLTGNIRPLAEAKLGALGLAGRLDLAVGAYGDAHADRAGLVPLARAAAGRAYAADFGGAATVLIGDTPLDVRAARVTGARAVAVATGSATVAELRAAGPDVLLPDLTDTAAVVAAVLGPA